MTSGPWTQWVQAVLTGSQGGLFSTCFPFTKRRDWEKTENLQRLPLWACFYLVHPHGCHLLGGGVAPLCTCGGWVSRFPPTRLQPWLSVTGPIMPPPPRKIIALGFPLLPVFFAFLLFLHLEQALYFPTSSAKYLKLWFSPPFIYILHTLFFKSFLRMFSLPCCLKLAHNAS